MAENKKARMMRARTLEHFRATGKAFTGTYQDFPLPEERRTGQSSPRAEKEYCAVSEKVNCLLACWYGADAIPAVDRENFKKETAEELRETIEQILTDPKKDTGREVK